METNRGKVHKIIKWEMQIDYVYDVETQSHDFNCSFPLFVHITDSFVLRRNTKDNIKDLKNLQGLLEWIWV